MGRPEAPWAGEVLPSGRMGQWEVPGKWPDILRSVTNTMMPNTKPENDSQLGPIGLVPSVYRVWMAIRKAQHRTWSVGLHEGRHERAGAATVASRTRSCMKVQHCRGQHTLMAFLVWHKCYERIRYWPTAVHAIGSRLQANTSNLYNGCRHMPERSAVAQPGTGNPGFVAGCALAKHILNACAQEVQSKPDATSRVPCCLGGVCTEPGATNSPTNAEGRRPDAVRLLEVGAGAWARKWSA